MSLSARVRGWAGRLKTGVQYLAGRDGRTPLAAKLTIALAVGYALSPIDLIPDLIPVLGYLDDPDPPRRGAGDKDDPRGGAARLPPPLRRLHVRRRYRGRIGVVVVISAAVLLASRLV